MRESWRRERERKRKRKRKKEKEKEGRRAGEKGGLLGFSVWPLRPLQNNSNQIKGFVTTVL